MPRNPALLAPATVSVPMVGRSARRSWPGLETLTRTPAGSVRRLGGAVPQHGIGSRRRLQRDNLSVPDHRRLPDVPRPEIEGGHDTGRDVGARRRIGPDGAESPFGSDQIRHHIVDADHAEPFAPQGLDDGAEHRVVAPRQPTGPRQHLHGPEIGAQRGHRRTADAAGHHQFADTLLAEMLECRSRGPEADPGMGNGRLPRHQGRVGLPFEGNDEEGTPLAAAFLHQHCRQRAAAGENAEFRLHLPAGGGRWRATNRRE